MKKVISILLAFVLVLCVFAGCNKEKPIEDTNTSSITEQQEEIYIEVESDTSETSTTSETTTSETETEKPTSAEPKLQLYKTYHAAHIYDKEYCEELWLYFEDGGKLSIVSEYAATESSPDYDMFVADYVPGAASHQHDGTTYYECNGAGYMDIYTVSGNKITTADGNTFTIISDTAIKRSDGVVFNIISDKSHFEE